MPCHATLNPPSYTQPLRASGPSSYTTMEMLSTMTNYVVKMVNDHISKHPDDTVYSFDLVSDYPLMLLATSQAYDRLAIAYPLLDWSIAYRNRTTTLRAETPCHLH